ncbi:flavodoxin family protein [Flavobacterium sp. HNIBRBA15423]|uniref:flavodoxin family protein n=1 Tax=Flavobacterium sp. HNIBRBA15423 TaxID=3458683 RepID=UPI0040440C07
MSKSVIIVGSSRKNGNTTRIVSEISSQFNIEVVNLSDYVFSYYDYESKNRNDDFFELVKEIIEKYDTLIFATPVYWYSMSGIMKVFFDRFSDLIRIEKETGRKLRGKNMAVISNSHDSEIDYDFYIPFKKSADYLGMNYLGQKHFNADKPEETQNLELAFI